MSAERLKLRQKLWPNIRSEDLWIRTERKGYTTIPRPLPLILSIMDSLSKGRPVSSTYLDLWCRVFDEGFVKLNKPREMATSSGFSGQRAEITWEGRMKTLRDLGFIDIKPGSSGSLSFALILNPFRVILGHKKRNPAGFCEATFIALIERAQEVGATDLDSPPLPNPAPAAGGDKTRSKKR